MFARETHVRAVTVMVMAVLSTIIVGCSDRPQRNMPSYAEYKAVAQGLPLPMDEEVEDDGDADFGPLSGDMQELDADKIATGAIADAGSIKGVILYAGAPRQANEINMSKTAWCADNHKYISESLIVSNSGGLKNVAVFVKRGFNRFEFTPPSASVLLNQDGCKYVPHVLTLMAGQPVDVRNSDSTTHNYHYSGANEEVNETQPNPRLDPDVGDFKKVDLKGKFVCDIHGWMFAPVLIFSHPYYALTDEEGAFEIKNLPPGTYEVAFVHEYPIAKPSAATVSVTVEAGKAAEITGVQYQ